MNDVKQINRIIGWVAYDPNEAFVFDKDSSSVSSNHCFWEKHNDYLKFFRELLYEKINEITNGVEWGLAFIPIEEATPSFEVRIYLDDYTFSKSIADAIKSSTKEMKFYFYFDGKFSDYINGKYKNEPPTKRD